MPETVAPPLLLDAAARLGARLCRDAIWSGVRCTWVTPVDEPDEDGGWRVVHRAAGPDLYGGTAGVALFLGHLHALTGEAVFRSAALGAARHAVSRMEDVPPPARLALHGGWTGIAYALWQVGEAVGADTLAAPALAALGSLAPDVDGPADAADGATLDVIGGAAGAIAPLLALADATGDPALLALARHAGARLLATQDRDGEAGAWRTIGAPGDPPLCGAAHGASGMATALLELDARAPDPRLREAARAAHAFEAAHFDAEAGGWPDRRGWVTAAAGPGAPASIGATWCHGSAGGALARLRALALDPGLPGLRDEATAALRATASAAALRDGRDDCSLCHGAAGLGEALLDGAQASGDETLRSTALDLARRQAEARRDGAPGRSGLIAGVEAPGLMLGDAGFGHHLLRLHAPTRVPSVLQVRPA